MRARFTARERVRSAARLPPSWTPSHRPAFPTWPTWTVQRNGYKNTRVRIARRRRRAAPPGRRVGARCCRIAAANKGRFVGRAGRKIVAFSRPVAARPRSAGRREGARDLFSFYALAMTRCARRSIARTRASREIRCPSTFPRSTLSSPHTIFKLRPPVSVCGELAINFRAIWNDIRDGGNRGRHRSIVPI